MTNVPTSSQTRPPGLAITSAQQAPGERLRVSVAGKELFSATFQTDERSGGARSSFRAGCGDPAAPPASGGHRAEAPRPGSAPTRGLPLSRAVLSRRFPPAPRCPDGNPQSSGHPRDAHSRRPAGRTHGPRSRGERGPAARVFPSCGALAAAPWKGPGVKRLSGSSAADFNAWADISPGPSASRAYFFFPFPSFPHFQDSSCINITSDRFLFTVGINLHLLGEASSEFPPAFPLGGSGCPVIYVLSPRGLVLTFPCASRSFR